MKNFLLKTIKLQFPRVFIKESIPKYRYLFNPACPANMQVGFHKFQNLSGVSLSGGVVVKMDSEDGYRISKLVRRRRDRVRRSRAKTDEK